MIGGFIGRLIHRPEPDAKFHPAGFVVGARAIVMLSLALVVSRTATVQAAAELQVLAGGDTPGPLRELAAS
ncbi:MAG TPA: hypothetical protein VMS64_01840 [Candidatus Methylomirabilis sp.]|nr:hypothetical protein [Candidatus Methylomirabilis sp.]